MKDTVIVVQGLSSYNTHIKTAWENHDIIFSTWKGEENKYTSSDVVIFNDYPSNPGPANFWLQQTTTINGLKKAKELGYKNALKIRSDIVPNNPDKLLSCFNEQQINFLCWHAHQVYPKCPGYLVDYFMYGTVDNLITLWDIKTTFCNVPEILLTWQYIENLKDKVTVNYILNNLDSSNDLFWIKNNIHLSSYQKHIGYKNTMFTFNNDKSFISEEYISFLKA